MNRGSLQKRAAFFLVVAFFIISLILVGNSISGMANTESSRQFDHYKYYTSIKIKNGDSLWTIAAAYMASENMSAEYGSIEVYINEIRALNQLQNDMIHTGQFLTIPYYSNEIL